MTKQRTALLLAAALLLANVGPAQAVEIPPWLPHYKLNIHLDVCEHLVTVKERVTWTNRHACPTNEVVFNAHSRFCVAKKDIGLLAKTLEILRMAPSEALFLDGPALDIKQVSLLTPDQRLGKLNVGSKITPVSHAAGLPPLTPPAPSGVDGRVKPEVLPHPTAKPATYDVKTLPFSYQENNLTALVVHLPHTVGPGESVTLELDFVMKLPQLKGRWGQWRGVTTLAQWLPVVAVYDEKGWQPVPFIPWHQPFFNEAGIYEAHITLPGDQKLACTAPIAEEVHRPDGWKEVTTVPIPARDFSLVCSALFCEETGQAGGVHIRSLYLPEHEFYGKFAVKVASESIPVYNQWFGQYPYPQFTIVESCFGWNGNECGGMVMIDERMYNMPHIATNYVDYLIAHEICHQWFYNVVGTNGYCETFMDEGPATYFSHRLADQKLGKNNKIINYPNGLKWLPNIHRDDFRNYGMVGVYARGEAGPTVQEMEKYKHLVNLMAMSYDRGSKVIGMIEERMGCDAFLDFMRRIYAKYYFRILRVCDFQRELEEYTGSSWEQFFQNWVHSPGMADWVVDHVDSQLLGPTQHKFAGYKCLTPNCDEPTRLIIHLTQRKECNEPAVLGISFSGEESYELRLPINPQVPVAEFPELNAKVESVCEGPGCTRMRIELLVPTAPRQISVDPDRVVLDINRCNNHWKPKVRFRFAPVYSQLEEIDVTNAHDSWNFIAGPWCFFSTYADPWYQRTSLVGLRAGVYRTQKFSGGGYLAYRADDRNIVAGVDGLLDHFPHERMQVGFNIEKSLATIGDEDIPCSRAVLFGRYILMYSSSLYQPPFEYVEVFSDVRNRCLPEPRTRQPDTELFNEQMGVGVHYHKYLLTPYWDPEGGLALDATYRAGLPVFGRDSDFHQVFGQLSFVKYMPDPFGVLKNSRFFHWLADSRWAFRAQGAAATPEDGLFFTLGGGDRFRGYDLAQEQGSAYWLGSVELRIPIAKEINKSFCDHVGTLRHLYVAPFYDVGNMYVNGKTTAPLAQAVGVGLRADITWLGLIERTMIRFDVAKSINDDAPAQFWFGFQHPF